MRLKNPSKKNTKTKKQSVAIDEMVDILYIEDDKIARNIGQFHLQKLGYSVDVACDVRSAKEQLCLKPYRLVLSDIGLPDGKGMDILLWIKSHPIHLNAKTPFLAITANSNLETCVEAKEAGFILVIDKPFEVNEVGAAIRKYILDIPKNNSDKKEEELESINDIIDLPATLHLCGDNMPLLHKIVKMAYDDLPNELIRLEELCAKNDIEHTRKLLHSIEGSSMCCVRPRLYKACKTLHDAIHNTIKETDNLSELKSLYKPIFEEADAFMLTYEKLVKEGKLQKISE